MPTVTLMKLNRTMVGHVTLLRRLLGAIGKTLVRGPEHLSFSGEMYGTLKVT